MLKRSYQKAMFLFLCGKELQTNNYKLTLAKYQVIKPCKILQSFWLPCSEKFFFLKIIFYLIFLCNLNWNCKSLVAIHQCAIPMSKCKYEKFWVEMVAVVSNLQKTTLKM